MRSLFQFTAASLLVCALFSCNTAPRQTAESLGWEIGTQSYTFRNVSFFDAVDSTKSLGLHYIEVYPGQKIGGGLPGIVNYNMDSTTEQKILDYLKKQDVKLVSFGVTAPGSLPQWDSVFVFAKAMGLQNITAQPSREQIPYVSKLCDEYHINVAIHNEPKPSPYWNPDTLLAAIQGQSSRLGACADVGHWKRSGLDPVECLKKLTGHVIELHFKDVVSEGIHADDTVWGTGVCNVKGMMEELFHQHFRGVFSVEYETNPGHNMPEIRKSLDYFNKTVDELK